MITNVEMTEPIQSVCLHSNPAEGTVTTNGGFFTLSVRECNSHSRKSQEEYVTVAYRERLQLHGKRFSGRQHAGSLLSCSVLSPCRPLITPIPGLIILGKGVVGRRLLFLGKKKHATPLNRIIPGRKKERQTLSSLCLLLLVTK